MDTGTWSVKAGLAQMFKGGVIMDVVTPEQAKIAEEAGCDIFVVQSTVTTPKHISSEYKTLDFKKFCKKMKIPVIIGNCVTHDVAVELMKTEPDALLIGIGPGAACTTRGVLGIGVPQVTATSDCGNTNK